MANGLNTLNLIQVKGGVNLKQGDVKSVLEYELGYTDGSDFMTDLNLDGKVAKVTLYNRLTNKKWTTDTVVKGNRVSFTIDVPLELGVYVLDIDVSGHIFPSDRETYVRVHEGYQSYMDGKQAIALVASAKNIADEAIRLAVLENAEKIRGPQGRPGESIRVVSVTKSGTSNVVKFSDGKTLTVEDGKGVFVDSYRILSDGNTELKFTDGKTAVIKKGDDSKVVSSSYDSEGNTVIRFNNGSPTITVQRGKQGLKGDTGNPVNVSSVSKSGLTTTVKFTDGKSMQVSDGKSVGVSSSRFLANGDTEVSFSDGKKVVVKKGVDGSVKYDDLTEEQRNSLRLDIVNDFNTGGSDKALSAECGKVLFQSVDNGKDLIAKAIIDKNGNANKDESFSDLASKIRAIKTGYGVGNIIPVDNLKAKVESVNESAKDWEFTGHTGEVYALTHDSQDNIYSGSYDKKVMKISSSGSKIWEFTGHTNAVRALIKDSQDNIYSGSYDKKVMKISSSGSKIWEFTGHTMTVNALTMDDQGNIYSGSSDKKVIKIKQISKSKTIGYEVIKWLVYFMIMKTRWIWFIMLIYLRILKVKSI